MILSEISVKRPVFATVLALLLAAFGIMAFTQLSTREYPDVSPAQVSIRTVYSGAAADVIETRITQPIEDEISGIEGIRAIRSSSTDGSSSINIEFELSRDIDAATNDVRDKVSRAARRLPVEAEKSTDPSHKELNFEGVLQDPSFRKLAIANPELAPYGAAAMKIIEDLKLANTIQDRVVMGENVGQTYALVASGNAELGFVALSQTRDVNAANKGTIWMAPPDLQEPIPQDAALLKRAEGNVAAKAFFDYLQSDDAKNIIRDAGYHVE